MSAILDWIIYFLILFLPFFIIVILPFTLSWIFGAKELRKTQEKYLKLLLEWARRRKLKLNEKQSSMLKLTVTFVAEKPLALITIVFTLIERRSWVWYLLKLFRKTPADRFLIQIQASAPPSALLYLIPSRRKKLLTNIAGYLVKLIKIPNIVEGYLVYSDDASAANYFSDKIIKLTKQVENYVDYIIIDYAAPHIEISGKVKRGHEILYGVELGFSLLQRFSFVRGRHRREDIAKFLRKALLK